MWPEYRAFSACHRNDVKIVVAPFWCTAGVLLVHTWCTLAMFEYGRNAMLISGKDSAIGCIAVICLFVASKSQQKLSQKQLDRVVVRDLVSSLVVQLTLLTTNQFKACIYF